MKKSLLANCFRYSRISCTSFRAGTKHGQGAPIRRFPSVYPGSKGFGGREVFKCSMPRPALGWATWTLSVWAAHPTTGRAGKGGKKGQNQLWRLDKKLGK